MPLANIRIQPFKGIYIGCSLLVLVLARIPYWTLRNLFPSWRPRRSWSISRCIQVNLTKFMMGLGGKVGGLGHNPTHKALETGKGVDGLYIDGVPDLVTGELKKWADVAGVECTRIPGYWHYKQGIQVSAGETPAQNEKVILAFHGGGYIGLSAHPSSKASGVMRAILAGTPSIRRAFSVEYRLAAPGANPFPSQLLDGLAGYSYLVHTLGFRPEKVIIVGDSAGANLALALTRYLIKHSDLLERPLSLPGGLVLLSPWVDLNSSHATPGSSVYTNARSDFIAPPPPKGPEYAPAVLVAPHGLDFLANEYISPASKLASDVSFKGFPRTFIVLGDAEAIVDSIWTLEKRMVADMGKDNVTTYVGKDGIHDFIAFEFFEPERTEAAVATGHWIEAL